MSDTNVIEGYPFKLSKQKIEAEIKRYCEVMTSNSNPHTVMQASSLAQLGNNELQSRTSSRVALLSLIASISSLFIAGLALYFSLGSSESSEAWERTRLDRLQSINKDINALGINANATFKEESGRLILKSTNRIIEKIEGKSANKKIKPTQKDARLL